MDVPPGTLGKMYDQVFQGIGSRALPLLLFTSPGWCRFFFLPCLILFFSHNEKLFFPSSVIPFF